MDEKLQAWRNELVNLTPANRLLYFRHTRSTLEIQSPGANDVLRRLLRPRGSWRFHEPNTASPKPDELVTQKREPGEVREALRALERRANEEFLDRGLFVLHLGFGVLEWNDKQGHVAKTPILLVPVELHRDGAGSRPRLTIAPEEPAFNPALAIKLEKEHGLRFELPDDLSTLDLPTFFEQLRAALPEGGTYALRPSVVLAPLSFHKMVMYRDLEAHHAEVAQHPLVRAVAGDSEAPALHFEPVPEAALDAVTANDEPLSILDADGSQRQSILAARDGKSFVLEGPPGTGKSQTIANIIGDQIGQGRSVLFVSDKAAALEVVQERLRAVGLADHLLELHSRKTSRRAVALELARILESPAAIPGRNGVHHDRLFDRRERLNLYAAAIHEPRPIGFNVYQAVGRLAALRDAPEIVPAHGIDGTFDAAHFKALLEEAAILGRHWGRIHDAANFPWRGLTIHEADATTLFQLRRELTKARTAYEALRTAATSTAQSLALGEPQETSEIPRLLEIASHAASAPNVPAHWLASTSLASVADRAKELRTDTERRATLLARLDEATGGRADAVTTDAASRAHEALAAIEPVPAWTPPMDLRADAIDGYRAFVDASQAALREIHQNAVRLSRAFGFDPANLTLRRAEQLCRLGLHVGTPDSPDPGWFDPAAIERAEAAIQALRPPVEAFRAEQQAFLPAFRPEVLDLDVQAIEGRFRTQHTGLLSRFTRAYRADVAQLKPFLRTGRWDADARVALAHVAKAKQAARTLQGLESQHAAVLGTQYVSTETDFERIQRSVRIARDLLDAAEARSDLKTLLRLRARLLVPEPEVGRAASELEAQLARWNAQAARFFGEDDPRFAREAITNLTAAAKEAAPVLEALGASVAPLAGILGGSTTVGTLLEALRARHETTEIEADVETSRADDQALLGGAYAGFATDWPRVEESLAWTSTMRDLLGGPTTEATAVAILARPAPPEALRDAAQAWGEASGPLLARFEADRARELGATFAAFGEGSRVLGAFDAQKEDIHVWIEYRAAREILADAGLAEVLSDLEAEAPANADVAAAIERSLLTSWLESVLETDGRLQPTSGRDALVEEFNGLDRHFIEAAPHAIATHAAQRRAGMAPTAFAPVLREAHRKRGHVPIRQLLTEAAEGVKALKPCFLMSPLTVSQFLPADLRFDVVVFDEASQVRPGDAINCIYRANQAIIAGDPNQLPPTSFFEQSDEADDAKPEAVEAFESVLDQVRAAGTFTTLRLRWHYRSRHEALITYSNQAFYGSRLLTFPNPNEGGEDMGVRVVRVAGQYRRGTTRDNPIEAQAVVERVLHHARTRSDQSLGIVAFSEAQAQCIERVLERARADHPELAPFFEGGRLGRLFVKNLETVQGDERDVILFSIGYGPDETGKFHLNLGPLNQSGGHRRLNVAITRAKRLVEIVTSVGSQDFRGPIASEGVRHLKRYLEFAETIGQHVTKPHAPAGREEKDDFAQMVAARLREQGCDVALNVGAGPYRVDVAVRPESVPGPFLLGVLLDGPGYGAGVVARDRDRLRAQVLRNLGWKVHMVWSAAWVKNPERELRRLKEAVEAVTAKSVVRIVKRRDEVASEPAPAVVAARTPVGRKGPA